MEVLVSLAILGVALLGVTRIELQLLSFHRASVAVHQAVQVSRAISAYQSVHINNTDSSFPLDWQNALVKGRLLPVGENNEWAVTWGGFEGDVCAAVIAEVRGCLPPLAWLDSHF